MQPQQNESLVRICKNTGKRFSILPKEKAFLDKYGLPYPDLHPDERDRLRRESMYERKFYTTKDAMTGEEIHVCIDPTKHPNWKFYGKNTYLKARENNGNLID